MNLLKRIKNLWKLSEFELPVERIQAYFPINKEGKPKMAQIINMKDNVKEFLKND